MRRNGLCTVPTRSRPGGLCTFSPAVTVDPKWRRTRVDDWQIGGMPELLPYLDTRELSANWPKYPDLGFKSGPIVGRDEMLI